MTRRGLLACLAGAVLDPERLIWEPGKRLISIPAPLLVLSRVQREQLAIIAAITAEARYAELFKKHLRFNSHLVLGTGFYKAFIES